MERENLCPDAKGEITSGLNREDQSTDARHRGGAARSRDEGSVMELDQSRLREKGIDIDSALPRQPVVLSDSTIVRHIDVGARWVLAVVPVRDCPEHGGVPRIAAVGCVRSFHNAKIAPIV